MNFPEILSLASILIAVVGTVASVLLLTIRLAGRIGILEGRMQGIIEIRDQVIALNVKVNTLWSVFENTALGGNQGLAKRGSNWVITEEGERLLPDDIKKLLDGKCLLEGTVRSLEPGELGPLVVQTIGIERLTEVAEKHNMTVAKVVALLASYCRKRRKD